MLSKGCSGGCKSSTQKMHAYNQAGEAQTLCKRNSGWFANSGGKPGELHSLVGKQIEGLQGGRQACTPLPTGKDQGKGLVYQFSSQPHI